MDSHRGRCRRRRDGGKTPCVLRGRDLPPGVSGGDVTIAADKSDGNFTLRRYRTDKGQSGRTPVEIVCTHEVLKKLVADLIDSIPT